MRIMFCKGPKIKPIGPEQLRGKQVRVLHGPAAVSMLFCPSVYTGHWRWFFREDGQNWQIRIFTSAAMWVRRPA